MLLGCGGDTRQFQQKVQMADGEGKTQVSLGKEKCLRALVLARERSASSHLRLGMLRAVQPSSAPCKREQ